MKIDTYLLMGEKEFFDTMKKYNRYLTSKERHILVIVAERFIKLNRDLCQKMPELKEHILKSAHSLGCNLGAVEFFIKNEKPILLELNPMWGGHASKHGFGNIKFQNYLKENRSYLEKEIPNVYKFMDRRLYYKNLFETISYHVLNKR